MLDFAQEMTQEEQDVKAQTAQDVQEIEIKEVEETEEEYNDRMRFEQYGF